MVGPIIQVADLRTLIAQGTPLILDCRYNLFAPQEGHDKFLSGHIPGAHYLHLDNDLSGDITPGKTGRHPLPSPKSFGLLMAKLGSQPSRQIVAYDDKGGGIAARAWWLLKSLGHNSVSVLDGGWQAWQDNGFQVETGMQVQTSRTEQYLASRYQHPTCDRAQTDEVANDPAQTLIDSRTPERYRGEEEPIDPVAGAIPGAINLPWPENLENGRFKSKEALRQRFGALQKMADRNVFYCGSGVTACHNILAYYYAFGEMPGLYPGSWSEYIV